MTRMPRMAGTPRMARWLADYPDPGDVAVDSCCLNCVLCKKKTLFKIITVKDPIEAPFFYLGT